MKTKHCGPCGKDKPASSEFFYGNRSKPDGFATECKECCKKAAIKRYEADPGKWNQQRLPYWKDRYRTKKSERDRTKVPDCLLDLTDTELAYIAGLIDGEGSFTICKAKCASQYVPVMSISMTSEVTIAWLAKKLGVSYQPVRRKICSQLPQFHAALAGNRLIHFCHLAIAFFITKRNQADAIVRFGVTYIPQKGNGGRHPEQVYTTRAAIKSEIHHLNRPHIYGPIPPELTEVLATLDQLASINEDN